jgi:hypothetical protein
MKPIAIAWGLAGLSAQAATYNFYFNNNEGPNSAPQVSVTSPTEGAPAVLSPAVPTAMTAAVTAEVTPAPSRMPSERRFRLWLGANLYAIEETSYNSVYDYENGYEDFAETSRRDFAGLSLNVGYRPLSYLALNFGVGLAQTTYAYSDGYSYQGNEMQANAELELIPVSLNLFGFRDFLELGASAGLTTLSAAPGNLAAVYVGARANLNFSEGKWFMTAGAKGNGGFIMGDAGLGMSFL